MDGFPRISGLRKLRPGMGGLRAASRALLLILLATCQVDKLTNNPPPVATLSVAPAEVRDSAAVGSTALDGDSLAVMNTGPGTLSWIARLTIGESWLAFVGPNSGTAPAKLRLAFNPAGLATGVYRDTVVVSAENASGSPGRVPVEFMVHPCRPVPIVPNAQLADSITTWDCGAPHRANSFARVYSFAANANDSISIAMSSTTVDAYLVVDSSATDTAPPVVLNDTCVDAGAAHDACVRYQRLAAAGTYRIEATSAGAGQTGKFTLSVTRPRAPTGPGSLVQLRSDSTTAIPLGGSTDQASVVLRGVLTDPDPGDSLRLEVEVRPVGTGFTGTPTQTGGRVANGQTGFVGVAALANNTGYHWQARTADQTGRVSDWTAFDGNPSSPPDFSTSVPVPPNAPTSLNQLQADGATPIPVGGIATARSVTFQATVTDPNPGDQLRLEVEVKPVGTAFTNVASGSGPAVTSGAAATAAVTALLDNTAYHWQARAVDQTARTSPWVSFGANPETATDFQVGTAANKVALITQPAAAAQSGVALGQQPKVQLQDVNGRAVNQQGVLVTATIATGSSSATLASSSATTDASGGATFNGLAISGSIGSYTLSFAAPGFAPVTSNTITLSAGPAARLALTTQPSSSVQNAIAFPQQPVVQLEDAAGNTVSQAGVAVTPAIATGGGTLAPTTAVLTTGAGAAAFSGLTLTGTVGARTLSFTSGTLTPVTSNPVTVTAGTATQIALNGGNNQTAPAGTAVATPPAVLVRDVSDNPVANVAVTFAVPGSSNGVITGANQTTNGSGIAQVTSWTLGMQAKPDTLTATSTGLTGSPVTFVDTAKVGTATSMTRFSGDNLRGQVGTTLATPHDVLVTDANANPVAGITVTWAPATGGGSVNPPSSVTSSTGHAQTTRTLGPTAGTQTTTASAPGLTTQTFTITAEVGGATQMAINGGDQQTGTVGQPLPTPISVVVRDALNNTVPGVTVSWSVLTGSGSVSAPSSVTDGSGVASITWTLGTRRTATDSVQTVQATAVASPLTFTAYARAGAVSPLLSSVVAAPAAITAGGSPSTITVTANDQYGNPVKGKTVVLAAAPITGNTLIQPAATTDPNGVATGTLSSTRAELKTVSATVGGVAITQQPTVTVNPAAANNVNFVVQPPASTTAGVALTPAVQVEIRDQFNNRVTSATNGVTLAIGTNPSAGTLTGGTPAVAAVSGVATFSSLSIDRAGTGYTLDAASTGLAGERSSAFTITAGAATTIALNGGNTQSDTIGATLAPYSVKVTDANNNPLSGITVTWAATGGGSITASSVTGATGIATATRVLGTIAGPQGATATVTGLTGSPVPFTATATHGHATAIAPNGGNTQADTIGATLATPYTVLVTDRGGNPVDGATVTWAASGGGSITPSSVSAITGIASATRVLGSAAGAQGATATVTGLTGSPVSFNATATHGNATTIALNGGSPQTGPVGSTLSPYTVLVSDRGGNPVNGITVTWAVTGGGSITPSSVTGINGIASATRVLVGSSRVDLQACKLEYSIVSPK